MTTRNVAIRIATEGKSEVKRDFADIGGAGQTAFVGIGDAADVQAKRATAAFDRATADIEAAQARQARAAAKIAAITPQTGIQMRIGDAVGTGFSDYEGSAKRSAAAFSALIVEQERMEAKARAIRAALDPLAAATDRYNHELAEMRALQAAGHISTDELTRAELRLKGAFDEAAMAAARGGTSAGARAAGFRQIGQNIGDVAAQASTGTSALMIFSMQAGQFAQAMELIGGNGKMGAVMKFIGGPWTQVIIAAISLFALFGDEIFEGGEKTEELTAKYGKNGEAARTLTEAIRDLTDAQDKNNLSKQDAINRSIAYSAYLYKEAVATRTASLAQLEKNKEFLAAATNRVLNPNGVEDAMGALAAAGGYQKIVDSLNGKIRQQTKDVADARAAYQNAKADRAEFFATADVDASARATKTYTDTVKALREQYREGDFGRGKEAEAELRRRIADAQRVRDAEKDAEKDAAKAKREAAKDAKAYAKSLDELMGRYDPLAAAAKEYREELEKIAELEKRGDLSKDKADEYRNAAEIARRRKIEDAEGAKWNDRQQTMDAILGRPGGIGDTIANDNDRIGKNFSADLDQWTANIEKKNAIAIASYQELTAAGEQFIDTVLSPDAWSSWGRLGKTIINEIRMEMLKLGLVNPLKNLLTGGSLPTIAGLFKSVGSVGAGGMTSGDDFLAANLGNNASGTRYWTGGMTWVAENGPELINLPRGSTVTPANDTRRMLAGASRPSEVVVKVEANDYFDARVSSISGGQLSAAAPMIADGGAQLAESKRARAYRQRLGRR